jgi:hypothetical protein
MDEARETNAYGVEILLGAAHIFVPEGLNEETNCDWLSNP